MSRASKPKVASIWPHASGGHHKWRPILVTPLAQEDLGDIWGYAAESGVERADRLLDLIYEKCQRLAEYPEMGRARHELLVNLRSFTVKNYVIFYQPTADDIEVLRILYGTRDIDRVFDAMIAGPNDDED